MPPEVVPTTAENVIAATDAVLLKGTGCDEQFVARFLDVPTENARNALQMASELGLVDHVANVGFLPRRSLAVYLVTAKEIQKAAVLRLVLEDYEPYKVFKSRLDVLRSAPQAAEQVKQLYEMTAHRDEIKDTLVNLGTYTQSLASEGAGRFHVAPFDTGRADFLQVVAQVAADTAAAEVEVRRRLGGEAAGWIDAIEVLSALVTAYQRLGEAADTRSPVLYAGNAVDSFLSQLGTHHNINLQGATGINAKVDRLANANHLPAKHKFMFKYLGHLRNAADHGTDPEIGSTWDISRETSIEYVHVTFSVIKSIIGGLLRGSHVL